MTTTPLPPPVPLTGIDCYIDPKDGKVKRYDQARADLEAEVVRLREALTLTFSHLVEHIDRWDDELLECKKTVKAVTGKQL